MALHPLFTGFLSISAHDRRALFQISGERLKAEPSAIEKDFFVCLVLDAIYNSRPESAPRMMFKGGTSLGKLGLIQRFSEDIDVVVFPEDLPVKDCLEESISGKERDRRIEALMQEAARYIGENLQLSLINALKSLLPGTVIDVNIENVKSPVLFVRYQSLFSTGGSYIQPAVRIEGGARSGLIPRRNIAITPYVAEDWGENDWKIVHILTISPERTFLEKIMVMHSWIKRSSSNPESAKQGRMSRHYYDVAMVALTSFGQSAINDQELLGNVRQHSIVFFENRLLRDAIPGTIKIIPPTNLLGVLRDDYQKMQGMIFGPPPKFDDILETISKVEETLNSGDG
jgi:hypothetical protein